MNEKFFFIVVIFLFSLSSCCTRRAIHSFGSRTFEVRENIGKLGNEQTQSAITSTELKSEIDGGLEEVGRLEHSIAYGEGDLEELKAILRRIRKRGKHKN